MSPAPPPLLSFALVCYNQQDFIEAALQGALEQTYSPLEIIILDDNSTDATFEIVQRIVNNYCGPHQITAVKNKQNLGIAENVNLALTASKGELVILAAGDDISLPTRTSAIYNKYIESGCGDLLIHSDVLKIDKYGNKIDIWRPPVISKNKCATALAESESIYIGASGALSRQLINKFNGIKYPRAYEDLVWGYRASIVRGLIYVPEVLVKYRVGSGISTQQGSCGKINSILQQHLKKRIMFIDVLKQRLDDIEFTHQVDQEMHRLIIKKRLSIELARAHLLESILKRQLHNIGTAPFGHYILAVIFELRDLIKRYASLALEHPAFK